MGDPSMIWYVLLGSLLASAATGAAVWLLANRLGAKSLVSARTEAAEILRDAREEAEKEKKQALLAAREKWYKTKSQMEKETQNRQRSLQKLQKDLEEKDLAQKESANLLKRRDQSVKDREKRLVEIETTAKEKSEKLAHLVEEENTRLERISGLTADEAKNLLMTNLKQQTRFEAAALIKEIKEDAQLQGDAEAQKIIALAIERQAADYSNERTATSVPIPNEKIKGRLIGLEGRNIKAFEKFTGIQLVVDESPDSVILSGFNPVKREIAKMVLEKLLKEGNITPQRIEEVSNEMKRKMVRQIQKVGEETLKELKIDGVHPEIVRLLGRLRYRTSYGQNVLEHSKEVARLTELMALELRLDGKLARRAGLFHDIGKAIDYEREGTHPEIGYEVAKKYGEPLIVQNAIASHHEDVEVISPISVLVSAADSISGARPGARRRTMVDYVKRVEKLESLADSMEGVEQSYAIQAGREIRVIAKHEKLDDAQSALLAITLAQKIQQEMEYPGKIKVTVIREMRAVDYAR
jgi:ribonuclease Y